MRFSKSLISWYLENKRDLPWRKSNDPYKIWLIEIMLQQTRVAQGMPYYHKFIEAFPTVFELAKASEEMVLKLWQGLGYYSRARNLHTTAKYVAEELNGVFPDNYKELKKLKGVGDYTASAIASICYDEPVAVVDGNVYRVLSRYFGIEVPINSTEGIKLFKKLAAENLDENNPSVYNQAIMEFGALHCKPKNPYCISCPLQNSCVAFQQGKIENLPVKLKKTKVKTVHFNYIVIFSGEKILVQQRTGKGIWKNLYQFPLIESKNELTENEVKKELKETFPSIAIKNLKLFNKKPIKHVLSHRKILAKFWVVSSVISAENNENNFELYPLEKLENLPVPVLIQNFIENFNFTN